MSTAVALILAALLGSVALLTLSVLVVCWKGSQAARSAEQDEQRR